MIWLARHGETTWNLAGRYQGRLESALTSLGAAQAAALAEYFYTRMIAGERVPTRVVSSPLLRCTATALFVAHKLGIEPETDDRLIEIGHGTWEGRYRDEIEASDPERYRTWRERPAEVAFDGGETLADVLARWHVVARELARADVDALVVSHDAVVRCALLDATDRPLDDFWKVRAENAAFATFAPFDGRLDLIEECHVDHLRELRADAATQAL